MRSQHVMEHAEKPVSTYHHLSIPLTMPGFVKIPEEQGEWVAKAAIAIHEGVPVRRMQIFANRKSEAYGNASLLKLSCIKITQSLGARVKIQTGAVDTS